LKRRCYFETRIQFARTLFALSMLCLFAAPFAVVGADLAGLTEAERAWLKAHPTVRLTPDPDFPPVEFFEKGRFSGIAADYVEILQEKLGIRFDIREVDSWSTSVKQTKARENDVWSAVAVTPERENYMLFSAPYIESPAVIIVRDDIKDALKVSDLAGLKVAVIKNYAIGALMRQAHPEMTFEDVPDAVSGLKRLSFGSLDAFIVNLAIASHTIKANSITNLRVAGDAGPVLSWRFAVRKDWPILRDLIDKALSTVTAEENHAIRHKWIALEHSGFRIDRTFVIWAAIIFVSMLFIGVLLWNRSLRQIVESRTAALRESENRIRTVVDNVIEGIITLDHRGVIQSVNLASLILFDADADDLIGQHVGELALKDGDDTESHPLVDYIFSGDAHQSGQFAEFDGIRHSGTRFPMEVGAREVVTDHDRFYVVILRDISERKEMDRLKSEFVSTVSHELRTPLTSIRGTLGLVMGGAVGELPEKAHEMVEIAERNTLRLLELVNDILDMEKIDSGRMEINPKPMEIRTLIEQAIVDNRAYAEQFGVEFVQAPGDVSGTVLGDETRLVQVMANLLSNAAKFSSKGSKVEIAIEDADTRVMVKVTDHGMGIPESFRDQIFERFTQADMSDKRQSGGTGLGLSISAAIIDAHGGTLDFDSEVGKGTSFYFDLKKVAA
jgi:PAS domain S-box-containing protein